MIDPRTVKRLLARFDPDKGTRSSESLARTQALLEAKSDPFDRSDYDPGHITASALVLSPKLDAVVLVKHARVRQWIQPGGHVEPNDASLESAAVREVQEETGLVVVTDSATALVRVDVHIIPPFQGEPSHLHHDLTFSFRAHEVEPVTTGDSEWRWCQIDELAAYRVEGALVRSMHRSIASFGS